MKQVRIRSIKNGEVSPWIYIQETTKQETPKPTVFQVKAAAPVLPIEARINQYGRFRYSEMQYGEMIERVSSLLSIQVSKVPVRIRNLNGDWMYFQQATIDGACPAIRIRSKNGSQANPWVYIQKKEV